MPTRDNTYNTSNFNKTITNGVDNSYKPDETQLGVGIKFNSNATSNTLNSFFYKISNVLKYIQESGLVLWQPDKIYNKGDIVSVIYKSDDSSNTWSCVNMRSLVDNNSNLPFNNKSLLDKNSLARNKVYVFIGPLSNINSQYWEKFIEDTIVKYNTLSIKEEYIDINNMQQNCYVLSFKSSEYDPNKQSDYYHSLCKVKVKRWSRKLNRYCHLSFTFKMDEIYNMNTGIEDYSKVSEVCISDEDLDFINDLNNDKLFDSGQDVDYYTPLGCFIMGSNLYISMGLDTCVDNTKNIEITVEKIYGDTQYILNVNKSLESYYNTMTCIKDNSTFDFGSIELTSSIKFSKQELYRRGLMPIYLEELNGLDLYSGRFSSKYTQLKYFGLQGFLPELKDKYLISDKVNDFRLEEGLPNIKAEYTPITTGRNGETPWRYNINGQALQSDYIYGALVITSVKDLTPEESKSITRMQLPPSINMLLKWGFYNPSIHTKNGNPLYSGNKVKAQAFKTCIYIKAF